MRHTAARARSRGQRVYAKLLKEQGATVNNEGNVYYNSKENFNLNNFGPTRQTLLRRQANRSPTRYNFLLKQAHRQANPPRPVVQNEASAFRKMLANVRARLRGTGRKLTN